MKKFKILVADDDQSICNLIKLVLEKEGFEVTTVFNGEDAVNEIKQNNSYNVIILDIVMPLMFGTSAANEIRKMCDTPIIFLTARSSDNDKVEAYKNGADDYLCKPFSTVELVLRVNALLKRSGANEDIEFLDAQKKVKIDGKTISLTDKEMSLLKYLFDNRESVLSVEEIYETVWQEQYLPTSNNTVMVFILNLRKKIEDDYTQPKHIVTVWGKGYKYA